MDGIEIINQANYSFYYISAFSEEIKTAMLKVNDSALEILNLLKEHTTEEKIVDSLAADYDTPREEIETFVKEYIARLRASNPIEEQ